MATPIKVAIRAPTAGSSERVEAQYAGAKTALRPVYEALAVKVRTFGPDVEFAPKKAYASLRRSKQFGLIQPTTATRVDAGRLELSGSFNAMVTHRVKVANVADINSEWIGWLRKNYDEA